MAKRLSSPTPQASVVGAETTLVEVPLVRWGQQKVHFGGREMSWRTLVKIFLAGVAFGALGIVKIYSVSISHPKPKIVEQPTTYAATMPTRSMAAQRPTTNLEAAPTAPSVVIAKRYANEIAYADNLRLGQLATVAVHVASNGWVHFGIYRPRAELLEHPLPVTGERDMAWFKWDQDTPTANRFRLGSYREDTWDKSLRVGAWRYDEKNIGSNGVFVGAFENKAQHISRCDWRADANGNVAAAGLVQIHVQLPASVPPKAILSIELDSDEGDTTYGAVNQSRTAYILTP